MEEEISQSKYSKEELREFFKQQAFIIFDILYDFGSISHNDLAYRLGISPKKLHTLLHRISMYANDYKLNIRISRGMKKKDIYYTLTYQAKLEYENIIKGRNELC